MNRRMALLSGASLLSAGCASFGPQTSNRALVRVVTDAEMAFARIRHAGAIGGSRLQSGGHGRRTLLLDLAAGKRWPLARGVR